MTENTRKDTNRSKPDFFYASWWSDAFKTDYTNCYDDSNVDMMKELTRSYFKRGWQRRGIMVYSPKLNEMLDFMIFFNIADILLPPKEDQ